MPAALALHLTGGAGNADPTLSLGGQPSGVACPETLFGDLDAETCRVGATEYRAVDLANVGRDTAHGVRLWLDPETPSAGTVLGVGLDATPRDSVAQVPAATRPPHGVTWSHPVVGSELLVPDVWPYGRIRLWLRRTVSPGTTALTGDGATLRWQYM